jgi:phosphopantetheine--protein transferase-like protein
MRRSANSLKAGGIIDLWFDSIPDLLRRIHPRDLLDSEELHRAERLRCDKNRARFIGGRILLRQALSAAVGDVIDPSMWRYDYGRYGKPATARQLPRVEFSISHTSSVVAVATCLDDAVGLDIEEIAATSPSAPIDDVLTVREHAWLKTRDQNEGSTGFIGLWTAKEAISKAFGLGIFMDFRDIEVNPDARSALWSKWYDRTGKHIELLHGQLRLADVTCDLSVAVLASPNLRIGIRLHAPPDQSS